MQLETMVVVGSLGFLGFQASLIGDYVFQCHWMAMEKTKRTQKGWLIALIHAFVYSLPFIPLLHSNPGVAGQQFLLIFVTHALIDHYRIASHWTNFYGVGSPGTLWIWLEEKTAGKHVEIADPNKPNPEPSKGSEIVDNKDGTRHHSWRNSVLPEDAPPFLKVWLMIINDNILHVVINTAVLSAPYFAMYLFL